MQICNAWFSSYLTSKPYEETIEAFKAHCDMLYKLGAKVIGASEQGNSIQGCLDKSILDEKPYYTDEQWEIVTKGFNEMGAYAKSKGMFFTVHHHMGTGVQTVEEIDKLMDMTDPDLVYLLFDSGHLTFAGIDPVPVLKKYINRVKHVHLKDVRMDVYNNQVVPNHMSFLDAVRAGVFTVPGDGDVDFKPILISLPIMITRAGLLLRLSRILQRLIRLSMQLRQENILQKIQAFNKLNISNLQLN